MPNKKTVALVESEYTEIINTMRSGGINFRANDRIATALVLEANLGLRIEDILKLRFCDFLRDGSRYRIDIIESKTDKKREFTVPQQIYQFIENFCLKNNISKNALMFPICERNVQKYLKKVVDYLGYKNNIGTHSFRKFYATDIYINNDHDIVLVQQLLQHSSTAITQKYIGISSEKVEKAIMGHISLL